jgi:hypothetical protein
LILLAPVIGGDFVAALPKKRATHGFHKRLKSREETPKEGIGDSKATAPQ